MLQPGKMLFLYALASAFLAMVSGKAAALKPALQTPMQVDAEVCTLLKKMRASPQFLKEAVVGLSLKERPLTLPPGSSGPDPRPALPSLLSSTRPCGQANAIPGSLSRALAR